MSAELPPSADELPLLYVRADDERCAAVAAFLEEHGVGHRRLEVDGDPGLAAEAARKGAARSLPVLDWRGHVLVAFDNDELVTFLQSHNVKLEDS